MSKPWFTVKLGEVISHRKEFVRIDDLSTYKRCRVQLHAKGIVLRDLVTGSELKTKEQQICLPGDFLVAEIDAKVGGYGIVPDELDGAIVSSHYFLFEINRDCIDPNFLGYFLRTPDFFDQVSARGTTNYAAIRPSHVLDYQIPLPPLEEQRRIVAKIDELANKIEEVHRLRQMTLEEMMTLVASRRAQLMTQARKFGEQVFDKVVEQIRGSSGLPLKEYQSTGRYPVIDQGQKFIAGYCDDERRVIHLPEAVVVWGDHTTNVKLIDFNFVPGADGTKVFVPKEGISATFLFHFLKSVNFPDLGYSRHYRYLKQVLIPVPQSAEQQRIVAELDALQTKAEGLKQLQAQTATEIDALLPSILDKAFKGEL